MFFVLQNLQPWGSKESYFFNDFSVENGMKIEGNLILNQVRTLKH
jgi:hypothetical protein